MVRAPLLLGVLAAILVAGSFFMLQAATTASSQWRMLSSLPSTPELGGLTQQAVDQYVQTEMAGSADLKRRPVVGMTLSLAAVEMMLRSGHVTSALMLTERLQNQAPGSTISEVARTIHGYLMFVVIGIVMAGAAFVSSYTMWRVRKATA